MNHWMFRCQDVSKMVSRSMDVRLPLHHRLAVWMHLLICRYCALFRRQLIMLRKMSRHIDGDPAITACTDKLSDEARERIKKTMRSRL